MHDARKSAVLCGLWVVKTRQWAYFTAESQAAAPAH